MDDELIDQIESDDELSEDDNTYGKKNIWKCPVCDLNRHVGNHKHCSKVTQKKHKTISTCCDIKSGYFVNRGG